MTLLSTPSNDLSMPLLHIGPEVHTHTCKQPHTHTHTQKSQIIKKSITPMELENERCFVYFGACGFMLHENEHTSISADLVLGCILQRNKMTYPKKRGEYFGWWSMVSDDMGETVLTDY